MRMAGERNATRHALASSRYPADVGARPGGLVCRLELPSSFTRRGSSGTLGRDPRERVVTVAYYALAKLSDHRIRAATDAMGVGWFALDDLPKLAFDHDDIVTRAHERLRGKVRYAPVGFELLPPRFSLTQLQRLYEIILGTGLDKRNFRKKILAMDLLVETDEVEQGVRHRAARLYRFDRRKYERLLKQGFELSI
jgi:8-oxo-dGTP diphosphatase